MVESKQQWKAWLYLAPAIILLLVFTVYPIINTVRISFLEGYGAMKEVGGATFEFGLGNYEKVLSYGKFSQCCRTPSSCVWPLCRFPRFWLC